MNGAGLIGELGSEKGRARAIGVRQRERSLKQCSSC
jgi:hypothetical protein